MKYNNLREVLFDKGISNTELAKMLNTSQSRVSSWKTNTAQPKITTLFKIAKVLEVSPRDLIAKENPII